MPLILRVLGGLSIEGSAGSTGLAGHRKSLALLALIAAAPNGGMTRERLQAIFWPEADEERARNALKQRLFVLRRTSGAENLLLDGAELRLNPAAMSVDLLEFNAAVRSGDPEAASELYAGPFLDGVHIGDSPELERWIEDQRARIADRARQAFIDAARAHANAGRHDRAADRWRQLAVMDPTSTMAAVGLVEALRSAGHHAAALNHVRVYESLVRDELGAEPDPVVAEAARRRHAPIAQNRLGVGASSHSISPDREPTASAAPRVGPEVERTIPITRDSDEHDARLEKGPPSNVVGARPSRRIRGRAFSTMVLYAAAVGAVLFAAVTLWPRVASNEVKGVIVTPFVNLTEDSSWNAFGDVAAIVLSEHLQRRNVANVIDLPTRVKAGFHQPNLDARNDTEKLAELARLAGASHIVTGSYHITDSQLVVIAAIRAAGDAPRKFAHEGASLNQPIQLLQRVEERLAGALATMSDRRLTAARSEESSSPTYAAYVEYVRGLSQFAVDDTKSAMQHFSRAFVLDTTFIGPIPFLVLYGGGRTSDSLLALFEQRQYLLTSFDRHNIAFWREFRRGKRDSMYSVAREMVRIAPQSPDAHWALGFAATGVARYTEAMKAFDSSRELGGWTQHKLFSALRFPTVALHMRGESHRNLSLVRQVLPRFPHDPQVCFYELQAMAFDKPLDDIVDALERCSTERRADERTRVSMRGVLALELVAHDREQDARRAIAPVLTYFRKELADSGESLVTRGNVAMNLLITGEFGEALALFERNAVDAGNPPPFMWSNIGVAAARSGNRVRANEALSRLVVPTQTDTRQAPMMHALRARVLASLGHHADALREIESAVSLGFAPAEWFHTDIGLQLLVGYAPYEKFMRGQ